jgi:hypothetical protein
MPGNGREAPAGASPTPTSSPDQEDLRAKEYPDCPYCSIIYLKPNRAERRRRARAGVQVPEWMALHADQCPLVGENYVPGHLVAGRARSAVR